MAFVSDDFHAKRLNQNGINIKTKFIEGNSIKERNSDGSKIDDINKGIVCGKEYYVNNTLKHKERQFDSRIEYTYVAHDELEKDHKCPNCGMEGKVKDFLDGCPYCGSHYNIEYTDKDLGSKYHYDRVLRNTTYRIVVGVIDLIISTIICFIWIKNTSRTFNVVDVSKVFIYGLILAMILYYFFYLLDAYVILGPIKRYKDRQNKKQMEFWEKTGLDKKEFYNNLNYEIGKYYYNKDNVVDYDIMDYLDFTSFNHDDCYYIKVVVDVRVVTYEHGKIVSKYVDEDFTMYQNKNDTIELKAGGNMIVCPNCGATIDVNSSKCEYCETPIKYLQKWILDKK